jgi:hypothetical protein
MRSLGIAIAAACVGLLSARTPLLAESPDAKSQAELAAALKEAKVSLEKALAASEREGKPISAKFEVEDGKLQLSVYTSKNGKFSEVIVDHETGKIAKTEPITGGEDLAAAKEQSEAMAKAKSSLMAVTKKALAANKGYRTVSVTPAMKNGHPAADVTLVKGEEFKAVSEGLD